MTEQAKLPKHLLEYRSICERFFYNQESDAAHLLALVDAAIANNPSLPLEANSTAILSLGLDPSSGLLQNPLEANLYTSLKSQIRSQFHVREQERLHQRFEEIIAESSSETNGKLASEEEGMKSEVSVEHARNELHRFVSAYRSQLGAGGFLRGLRAALQALLGQPIPVLFRIHDDSLLQHGEAFAFDALRLLFSGIGAYPSESTTELLSDQSPSTANYRWWIIGSRISDDTARILLNGIPSDHTLPPGRPMGEVKTGDERITHRPKLYYARKPYSTRLTSQVIALSYWLLWPIERIHSCLCSLWAVLTRRKTSL
ncbi:uncharacterized protein VTP21DRAFT_117 [Calcarisporiella thermophila]|uniref:uncharacterized protein n=1 Tax=Calcarisporiella thermophila TaxID=911321 RepID=UPI00374224B8